MFQDLKNLAIINKIPVILDDGLLFIKELILKEKIKHILEIGTAISYSAHHFASLGCIVDTIERDPLMIEYASEYINKLGYEKQINLIIGDAELIELKRENKYDLIFIDAAKAKNKLFFEKYEKYLNKKGLIVSDNINFHNLDINKVNRRTKRLLQKIEEFKTFLINNEKYNTTFYNVGDGISVSRLK